MADRLYTVKEAAEILSTSENTIYKLHKAGLLKFMKLGHLKIRKVTLEAFLEQYDGMDVNDPNDIREVAV